MGTSTAGTLRTNPHSALMADEHYGVNPSGALALRALAVREARGHWGYRDTAVRQFEDTEAFRGRRVLSAQAANRLCVAVSGSDGQVSPKATTSQGGHINLSSNAYTGDGNLYASFKNREIVRRMDTSCLTDNGHQDEWGLLFDPKDFGESAAHAVNQARELLRVFHTMRPMDFHHWSEVTIVIQELRTAHWTAENPMMQQLISDLMDALQAAWLTSGYEEAERTTAMTLGGQTERRIGADSKALTLQRQSTTKKIEELGTMPTLTWRLRKKCLSSFGGSSSSGRGSAVGPADLREGAPVMATSLAPVSQPRTAKRVGFRSLFLSRLPKFRSREAAPAAASADGAQGGDVKGPAPTAVGQSKSRQGSGKSTRKWLNWKSFQQCPPKEEVVDEILNPQQVPTKATV